MSIQDDLAEHSAALAALVLESSRVIEEITDRIATCFEGGGKLLLCGNGGSAADAQHFAAEFVNRMHVDRHPLPAVALTTDTSVVTSIANDAHFEQVFSRQVDGIARPGDVLVAFSTSGRSPNVVAALDAARRRGVMAIAFTGRSGATRLAAHADLVLATPSDVTPRIQEGHEFAYHVIAAMVERRMFGSATLTEPAKEAE